MANTGRVIVLTLKEMEEPANTPTGNTKANAVGDADYIAPYVNTTTCPITYTTICPVVVRTPSTNSLRFEFGLPSSTINNPAISKVKIKAMLGATEASNVIFSLPITSSNYFSGTITSLTGTTGYTLQIDYLNSSNTVVANCPSIGSFTTT